MDVLEAIHTRRSVRHFSAEPVGRDLLLEIVRAGTRAPSGLNNQPWRFVVIRDEKIRRDLSGQTRYTRILLEAPAAVAVFCDREAMYSEVKDYQGIGACLQNMLLAAHGLGLGAVWLGEILKNAGPVRQLLGLEERYDLMAVVAIGHPGETGEASGRLSPEQTIIKEF